METREVDVVILGAGFSGLSTALIARRKGLQTVLLEKADKVGGGSSHSYGILWAGSNHLAEAAGIVDMSSDVRAYLQYVEGGHGEPDRMAAFQNHSPVALKELQLAGVPMELLSGLPDHYHGRAPGAVTHGRSVQTPLFPMPSLGEWQSKLLVPDTLPQGITCEELVKWGGVTNNNEWDHELVSRRIRSGFVGLGPGLVGYTLRQALRNGATIILGCGGRRLLKEDGRVVGVEDESGRRWNARKGVVVATGGYDSNESMIRNLEGLPSFISLSPDTVDGDGIVMASEVGAGLKVMRDKLDLFLGFRIPKRSESDAPRTRLAGVSELFCPHTVVVNRHGKRFGDESYFQELVPALRTYDVWSRSYVNLPCFLILDQQYASQFSFAGMKPGSELPDWVARGSTVEELGSLLGIHTATLVQTIERFNGMVKGGCDIDFHRGEENWRLAAGSLAVAGKNASLGTIAKPPFFGIELHPSGSSSTGVSANIHGQALHLRGKPIEGLYAIGNTAARDEYGVGYQAGFTLTSGLAFGSLALAHMTSVSR